MGAQTLTFFVLEKNIFINVTFLLRWLIIHPILEKYLIIPNRINKLLDFREKFSSYNLNTSATI